MLGLLIVSGVALGGLYILIATGLTIVFSVMDIPFFTHAGIIVLGFYLTYWLTVLGYNFLLAAIISMMVCASLAVIIEKTVIKKMYDRPPIQMFMAVWGLLILIQSALLAYTGAYRVFVPPILPGAIKILGTFISYDWILLILASLSVVLVIHIFLKKSKFGKAIRAVSQDKAAASTLGINIGRVRMFVFAIAGMCAGIAGSLLGIVGGISPYATDFVIMVAFCVIITGGMGSIPGTVIAGFIIGFVSAIAGYVSGDFREAIIFLVPVIILIIKPGGIVAFERRK